MSDTFTYTVTIDRDDLQSPPGATRDAYTMQEAIEAAIDRATEAGWSFSHVVEVLEFRLNGTSAVAKVTLAIFNVNPNNLPAGTSA